eukprot:TRINITY_DN966_c0_g1_i1.p1 TRINITY_DN966_c0_g1~~TRINITY_DN966_c0_g1_i1.p1  ORF type:complete len:510 (+),score=55.42 TRINITY_DN966_c0_g1_i1:57-1532(+)
MVASWSQRDLAVVACLMASAAVRSTAVDTDTCDDRSDSRGVSGRNLLMSSRSTRSSFIQYKASTHSNSHVEAHAAVAAPENEVSERDEKTVVKEDVGIGVTEDQDADSGTLNSTISAANVSVSVSTTGNSVTASAMMNMSAMTDDTVTVLTTITTPASDAILTSGSPDTISTVHPLAATFTTVESVTGSGTTNAGAVSDDTVTVRTAITSPTSGAILTSRSPSTNSTGNALAAAFTTVKSVTSNAKTNTSAVGDDMVTARTAITSPTSGAILTSRSPNTISTENPLAVAFTTVNSVTSNATTTTSAVSDVKNVSFAATTTVKSTTIAPTSSINTSNVAATMGTTIATSAGGVATSTSRYHINSSSNSNTTMNASNSGSDMLNSNNSSNATAALCVTQEGPRATLWYTASPPGTPCVFGVDPRDESTHCIMEDGTTFGEFGWCWTSKNQSSWGSCNSGCRPRVLDVVVSQELNKLRDAVQRFKDRLSNESKK